MWEKGPKGPLYWEISKGNLCGLSIPSAKASRWRSQELFLSGKVLRVVCTLWVYLEIREPINGCWVDGGVCPDFHAAPC